MGGVPALDGALFARVAVVVTAVKALLIPAYHSTDFEVHRNWLAITHSLPLRQWYTEATSPWTLDYPPLFAWFERLLAVPAARVDPDMLRVDNLDYDPHHVVVFQRATVIVSDLLLVAAAWRALAALPNSKARDAAGWLLVLGTVCSPGLLMVDHIHFQYNGALLGLFLWSVLALEAGRDILGGVLFAALLNAKHIFLYAAPAYFVYLLRHYCFPPAPGALGPLGLRISSRGCVRLLSLGVPVALVFAASLGPFLALGQGVQLLARLFPFRRGLCHAYWAPNVWAVYAAADKVAAAAFVAAGKALPDPSGRAAQDIPSGGAGCPLRLLPDVGPGATFGLTMISMTPALVALWRDPQPKRFLRCVTYCMMCSFMLGYHVHEKAALMVSVPLAVIVARIVAGDSMDGAGAGRRGPAKGTSSKGKFSGGEALWAAWPLLLATVVMHAAQWPLLFQQREYPIKIGLVAAHALLAWSVARESGLTTRVTERVGWIGRLASAGMRAVSIGIVPLEMVCLVLRNTAYGTKLPFLELMLTSLHCAAGMLIAWAVMLATL
ncbi:unnamed protein product [Pedinophyceae sp. YPF-701]|nr:unnamed protein product [Pedinophyceae sp. YPF-701]